MTASPLPRVFILTWKPEVNEDFKEDEFNKLAKICWKNTYVDTQWRFSTLRYEIGDLVMVIRQGKEPGLVAFGVVLEKNAPEEQTGTHYTQVRLNKIRDTHEHPFLTKKEMLSIGMRKSLLESQASGHLELNEEEFKKLDRYLIDHLKIGLIAQCVSITAQNSNL